MAEAEALALAQAQAAQAQAALQVDEVSIMSYEFNNGGGQIQLKKHLKKFDRLYRHWWSLGTDTWNDKWSALQGTIPKQSQKGTNNRKVPLKWAASAVAEHQLNKKKEFQR